MALRFAENQDGDYHLNESLADVSHKEHEGRDAGFWRVSFFALAQAWGRKEDCEESSRQGTEVEMNEGKNVFPGLGSPWEFEATRR